MAIVEENICQEAIDELQVRLAKDGRAGMTRSSMNFIFDTDVDRKGDLDEIVEWLEAQPWTQEVQVLWSDVKIVLYHTSTQ